MKSSELFEFDETVAIGINFRHYASDLLGEASVLRVRRIKWSSDTSILPSPLESKSLNTFLTSSMSIASPAQVPSAEMAVVVWEVVVIKEEERVEEKVVVEEDEMRKDEDDKEGRVMIFL
ncbi:hypothetical protein AgCh_007855 [Apium graveolens]